MLGFSPIGRRSRSCAASGSTIDEKYDRWLPYAVRSRHPVRNAGKVTTCGGMAEWSKAPVLKTGEVHASVGSNPTPSATAYRVSFALPNAPRAFNIFQR